MLARLRKRLTFSNLIALSALFIALGGTSYAVTAIDKNSVRSPHIVNGEVKTADLANGAASAGKIATNAVNSGKVAPDSLAAGDLGSASVRPSEIANRAVTQTKVAPPEALRTVGAAGQPALGPEWDNIEGATFYRDPYGRVYLGGRIVRDNGTGASTIFTLPPGYRPGVTTQNGVISNGDMIARVDVEADGDVRYLLGGDPGAQMVLDGISFRCAPSGVSGCP